LFDIAYPTEVKEKYPVIIQIHGGGWVYGSKDTIYRAYGMALAQQGFAVITCNYRLAPAFSFPSQLFDIDLLLLYIQQNASQLSLDIDHVFMIGDSAGAHLISLYQCLRNSSQNAIPLIAEIDIKAVALSCGVYDFDTFNTPKIKFPQKTNTLRSLFGSVDYRSSPLYPYASVSKLITADFPDALVISSQFDPLYPQSEQFLKILNDHSIIHQTYIAERKRKLPHVFNTRLTYPESIEVLTMITNFFKARVKT
jgi:acetyl esterase/lipase